MDDFKEGNKLKDNSAKKLWTRRIAVKFYIFTRGGSL